MTSTTDILLNQIPPLPRGSMPTRRLTLKAPLPPIRDHDRTVAEDNLRSV